MGKEGLLNLPIYMKGLVRVWERVFVQDYTLTEILEKNPVFILLEICFKTPKRKPPPLRLLENVSKCGTVFPVFVTKTFFFPCFS